MMFDQSGTVLSISQPQTTDKVAATDLEQSGHHERTGTGLAWAGVE
jgi:hypothetical protein